MEKENEGIFIPEKTIKYNQIFDMGNVKYKRCPVCRKLWEFPDDFLPEGLCDFCLENMRDLRLFGRYLKAIKKGYIRPVNDVHNYFFTKN
ncbi:MAG: hypothetical protein ACFFG0_26385 [Candidatus Thorarchaeota archaeon]